MSARILTRFDIAPTPGLAPDPTLADLSDAQLRAQTTAHLDWLATRPIASAGWTDARDLALAEALMRGDGIAGAARACATTPERTLNRWRALMPHRPPTLRLQEVLLATLRDRIARDTATIRPLASGGDT